MEHKFKVGDEVRIVKRNLDEQGCLNKCRWDPDMDKYIGHVFILQQSHFATIKKDRIIYQDWYWMFEWLELVKPSKPQGAPKFLLRYDRESDPVEEFASLPDVRKRVKELLADSSVKQDSFKVYEIKTVLKVKVDQRVSISAK